jgi:UDP-glucuronate decarboxylase
MGLGSARKTVLVTGAAGFLGSHLVDRLLAEGYEVVGLDNLMTGDLSNLEQASKDRHFHLEIGDVREPLTVYAQIIFNFACPASPVHYQADPYATLTTSVLGALRLAEHARLRKVRIVHASTSEVYGDPLEHPQKEEDWGHVNPVGERACYDEGKRAAESILTDAKRQMGADVRIVRIFNTYGPRMAFNDGRVVSNFLAQTMGHEPITIYGDGSQSRSFCYVDDLIEGIVRVSRLPDIYGGHPKERPLIGPLNLGNPTELTMRELAEAVFEVVGHRTTVVQKELPPDDPRRRCPDILKAKRLIDFSPITSIRDGLRATLEDFTARRAETEP